jgi:hypothetical protein
LPQKIKDEKEFNMESKNVFQRLMNNAGEFLNKVDEYNESRLWKVSILIKYAFETAKSLGLDPAVVSGIIIGDELTRTAYLEVGERYLREKNPSFSKIDFAKRMMTGILEGTDSEKTDLILDGMERLENRNDSSPEQKLAFMLIDGHRYAEGLDTKDKRNICLINYKNRIMVYSKEKGKLTGPVVPVLENPRKAKRNIDEERVLSVLESVHQQFQNHIFVIPGNFERALEGLDKDAEIAYYMLAHPETVIEKWYETRV